uniref:Transmembrane protein 54 n=2 Tax=Passeroidea TaxID=175121 RepID=A0A674GJM8_TAEGU
GCVRGGHLDPSGHRNVLMKTGLILLIVGHLNFITGALVHGTVLRFVVTARDATSLHYGVTNSASVIAALLVGRGWTLSCASLCCLCRLLGLLVAIGLTLGTQGRVLLAPCSISDTALAPVSHQCPFDPTRVYSSTLSLWAVSVLLEAMGTFFSLRCLLLTLELIHPCPWGRGCPILAMGKGLTHPCRGEGADPSLPWGRGCPIPVHGAEADPSLSVGKRLPHPCPWGRG